MRTGGVHFAKVVHARSTCGLPSVVLVRFTCGPPSWWSPRPKIEALKLRRVPSSPSVPTHHRKVWVRAAEIATAGMVRSRWGGARRSQVSNHATVPLRQGLCARVLRAALPDCARAFYVRPFLCVVSARSTCNPRADATADPVLCRRVLRAASLVPPVALDEGSTSRWELAPPGH